MDFRDGEEKVSIHVPRRSLLIIDNEARYAQMCSYILKQVRI